MEFVTYHLQVMGIDPVTMESRMLQEIGIIYPPLEIDVEQFREFKTQTLVTMLLNRIQEQRTIRGSE